MNLYFWIQSMVVYWWKKQSGLKNLVGIEIAVEYIGVAKRRLEESQSALMHLSSKKQKILDVYEKAAAK